jgi:hypothetical protein
MKSKSWGNGGEKVEGIRMRKGMIFHPNEKFCHPEFSHPQTEKLHTR